MPATGLYLHVPFCVRRCLYCDFYVLPLGSGPLPKRLRDFRSLKHRAYLRALENELRALPRNFQPLTVYVGGGTPTELPPDDLQRLFDMLHAHVDLSRTREFTCEANPGTLDPTVAHLLADAGVNRVSLGVQSFDDNALETLGRIHTADDARRGLHDLREAGIPSIGVDLLFALPNVPLHVIDTNLDALHHLRPDHVSWYSLEFEPGTAFTDLRDRGFLSEPDDHQTEREYHLLQQGLLHLGYQHYELFSFCLPHHRCAHNLNYWRGGEFHGCGPSAHAHIHSERRAHPADLTAWTQSWLRNTPPHGTHERLPPDRKARERLMTELRLTDGVHAPTFHAQTGFDPLCLIPPPVLEAWTHDQRLIWNPPKLRLHPKAYLISDSLFRDILEAEDFTPHPHFP